MVHGSANDITDSARRADGQLPPPICQKNLGVASGASPASGQKLEQGIRLQSETSMFVHADRDESDVRRKIRSIVFKLELLLHGHGVAWDGSA